MMNISKILQVGLLLTLLLTSSLGVLAVEEAELYVPEEYSFTQAELEQLGVFIEQVPFLTRGDSFLFTIEEQEYVLFYEEDSVRISQEQDAIVDANFAITMSEETIASLSGAGADQIIAALKDGSIDIEGRSLYAWARVSALRLVLLVL